MQLASMTLFSLLLIQLTHIDLIPDRYRLLPRTRAIIKLVREH